MNKSDFTFVDQSEKLNNEQIRQNLTYWSDAWRRLKKNKVALAGLFTIIVIIIFSVFGPLFTNYSYSDQVKGFTNLPPRLTIYKMEDDTYFYFNSNYYTLYTSNEDGKLLEKLDQTSLDSTNRLAYYDYNGETVTIDYSYKLDEDNDTGLVFTIIYDDTTYSESYKTTSNKLFAWGSDNLGRDILTRVMYGTRISLFVALVATFVNLFIGVLYGSLAGLKGGVVDQILMFIINIINSIPLLLFVILIMVILDDTSMLTIIITLGAVYWVSMARLVRGQVLALKNQEFVLAAKSLGVSQFNIILKHLIPNSIGPILVSLTMMIPSAIFTESFLSFIGLGASAPQASLGTLASDSIEVFRTAFYQLMYPAGTIAILILAFNFFGDGLRSALDPKLRKG
jgi:oligopeptide transport system permease protein